MIRYGTFPPLATIALSLVFLYANPYNNQPLDPSTVWYIYLLLILPAAVAILASVLQWRKLTYIAFVWSLPVGLYLGLAGVPSYWTWFILFIALYLLPSKPGIRLFP